MVDTGQQYGPASSSPIADLLTGDYSEVRQRLRSIANDLAAQVHIVTKNVVHFFATGEHPPPHYAWRIAIILRKQRRYATELAFLECYARHFCAGPGTTEAAIRARIPKTRKLLESASGQP